MISIESIAEMIREKDWLIHNFFNLNNNKLPTNEVLYDVDGFIKFILKNEYEYTLILDRNIFDYIIKSLEKSNELHKSAIALILYCQYMDILIEPNLAIYEKFQRDKLNLEEVNTEYKKFQYIDNSKKELVDFVSGSSVLELKKNITATNLPNDFDKIDRPTNFTTFELGVLKLCTLYFDSNIKRQDKFRLFIEYSQGDYLISIPLIVYAILLFDKETYNGIMKVKKVSSKTDKEQAIYNMTWDIYSIDRYYGILKRGDGDKQYLFASADKLLSKILRICIKISYGEFEFIDESVKDKNNLEFFKEWIELARINKENTKRVKMTKEFLDIEKKRLKGELLFLPAS